jgi:hypothetical protein
MNGKISSKMPITKITHWMILFNVFILVGGSVAEEVTRHETHEAEKNVGEHVNYWTGQKV